MKDHTPELWADYDNDLPKTLSATDYDRARACVNACAGIPTEQLGKGSLAELLRAALNDANYQDEVSRKQYRAALAPFRETKT